MILPGQNFAPSLSVSQQVVSHVKSVAHNMFPGTTAMLFYFNNSSMCHLFLFPIWLFLNLPDKILLLELHTLVAKSSAAEQICIIETISPLL